MQYKWMLSVIFFLIIIEKTVFPLFFPTLWSYHIMPHFSFLFVLYSGVYTHRYQALYLGLGFGLLEDLMNYGSMLGPYMLTMSLLGYLNGWVFYHKRAGILYMFIVLLLGNMACEHVLYGIYSIFKMIHLSYRWNLEHYILPTTLLQVILGLMLYYPVHKWLIETGDKKREEVSV